MPAPHKCYDAYTALKFTVIEAVEKSERVQKVVFERFVGFKEVVDVTSDSSKVQVGDELLKINGQDVNRYIEDQAFLTGAASKYGILRGILDNLSVRSGMYQMVPEKNSAVYEMRSVVTGNKYTIDIPWVARCNEDCKSDILSLPKNIRTYHSNNSADLFKKLWIQGRDTFIELAQEAFGTTARRVAATSSINIQVTDDPSIQWAIYDATNTNMGIIYLSSFLPRNYDPIQAVLTIRSLLLNQLKNTTSVIFDVRDNLAGGYFAYAESLSQLFGSDITTTNWKAIVSRTNQQIFINNTRTQFPELTNAYLQTLPGAKYTANFKLTETTQLANSLGQVYLRPVGVFLNGNCHSTCEVFSANMQDNRIAMIFGEDGSSGGTGSYPLDLSTLSYLLPEAFALPPFMKENSFTGILVPWLAVTRTGLNKGKLIEDSGVVADKVFRPVLADLNPDLPVYSQYNLISKILDKQALLSGKKFMFFQISPQDLFDLHLGSAVQFKVTIQGLSIIKIYNESKKLIKSKKLPRRDVISKRRQTFVISILPDRELVTFEKFYIKVYDIKGLVQMNTFRTIRRLPRMSDYFPISKKTIFSVNFKKQGKYFVNYDHAEVKDKKLGFNPANQGMMIGDGKQYALNFVSTLTYFINASVPFKTVVKARYDTELDYDFLTIGFIKDGVTTHFLESINLGTGSKQNGLSGKGDLNSEFELPSGIIEFFIRFVSDLVITSVGVTVNALTFIALE